MHLHYPYAFDSQGYFTSEDGVQLSCPVFKSMKKVARMHFKVHLLHGLQFGELQWK